MFGLAVHLVASLGLQLSVPPRSGPLVASALLTAPPSPPPTRTSGGGGGGGDGDGGASEFLRLINAAEQGTVLEDWAARSRIYKLTAREDLSRAHVDAINDYEDLRHFDTTNSGADGGGRPMLLGLFAEDQLAAMASAEVSRSSGLIVSRIVVYPAELNDADSTASLRMVHALYLLAEAIETPLNLGEYASIAEEATALWEVGEGPADDA